MQDETPIPIEVYTTKHLGSAIQIYELIESCIERKEARNRNTIDDGLEKKYFGQDDQWHTHTKQVNFSIKIIQITINSIFNIEFNSFYTSI